jgi:hypothetical protein
MRAVNANMRPQWAHVMVLGSVKLARPLRRGISK